MTFLLGSDPELMLLNARGYPMRNFVRCYRVSWFITNGWYSPALKSRMRELNKWPPPEKYTSPGLKSRELLSRMMSLKLDLSYRCRDNLDQPFTS